MDICVHKSGTMQQIQLLASRGYVSHFGGEVAAAKAQKLVARFSELYEVSASRGVRYRRRKAGHANASLVMHPVHATMNFQWIVLLTEGDHPARQEETLWPIDDRRHRVVFDHRFELIQLRAKGGGLRWTWRLTHAAFDDIAASIKTAMRHRGDERDILRIARSLYAFPGFRGVRQQIYGLTRLFLREWERARSGPCPYVGENASGYLRFIEAHMVPLGAVVDRMLEGQSPFDPAWVYTREKTLIEREA